MNIENKLKEIMLQYNVKILHAAVTGSRATGLHNQSSDYDVKFVYYHTLPYYLQIQKLKDTIEYKELDYEFVGWDLPKALHLASKSNVTLIETLLSDEILATTPIISDIVEILFRGFNQYAVLHQYRGIMHLKYRHNKDYLYKVRAKLCLEFMRQNNYIFPPLNFYELEERTDLRHEVTDEISKLLWAKVHNKNGLDSFPVLDKFMEEEVDYSDATRTNPDLTELNRIYRRVLLDDI